MVGLEQTVPQTRTIHLIVSVLWRIMIRYAKSMFNKVMIACGKSCLLTFVDFGLFYGKIPSLEFLLPTYSTLLIILTFLSADAYLTFLDSPSHENFKPYHIGFLDSVDDIQAVWPTLLQHKFFRSICEDDLVTLEECALQEEEVSGEICNNTNDSASKLKITSQERKRFEVRLVGWEHLAGDFANYDF